MWILVVMKIIKEKYVIYKRNIIYEDVFIFVILVILFNNYIFYYDFYYLLFLINGLFGLCGFLYVILVGLFFFNFIILRRKGVVVCYCF